MHQQAEAKFEASTALLHRHFPDIKFTSYPNHCGWTEKVTQWVLRQTCLHLTPLSVTTLTWFDKAAYSVLFTLQTTLIWFNNGALFNSDGVLQLSSGWGNICILRYPFHKCIKYVGYPVTALLRWYPVASINPTQKWETPRKKRRRRCYPFTQFSVSLHNVMASSGTNQ